MTRLVIALFLKVFKKEYRIGHPIHWTSETRGGCYYHQRSKRKVYVD